MAFAEIAAEIVSGALRFAGRIGSELVFEVLVKGAGYLLARLAGRRIDPDGLTCILLGTAVWITLAVLGFWLYRYRTP